MRILINENQFNHIINDGSIKLTPSERQQVEDILPKAIEAIAGKDLGSSTGWWGAFKKIGRIKAVSADGEKILIDIFVGNNISDELKTSLGYYNPRDPKNPNDNFIVLQQRNLSTYFKGPLNIDSKINKFALGTENPGIEQVRGVLKHEIIHAKDPNMNQHWKFKFKKEPENSKEEEKLYYSSWEEFKTMSGQLLEAIIVCSEKAPTLGMEKKDIINGLDNILMLYAGKTKSFNQNAKDLIQGSGKRNIFQKVIVNSNIYQKYLVSGNFTPVETYHAYLQKIKEHNPKGYNKFLRELYKTINEVKVNTNNTNEPSTTEEG